MLKKIGCLLLALCCLCGCNASSGAVDRSQPGQVSRASLLLTGIEDEVILAGNEISFFVDASLGEVYLTAAENFAQTVRSLTNGQIIITVQESFGAENHFVAGRTQMTFVDSGKSQLDSGYMNAFAMPFLYTDYDSFTMAVNKEEALRILGDDVSATVGTVFLAGYYQPSKHLLTNWQAANYRSFPGTMLAVEEGSAAIPGFVSLGTMILEESDIARRIYLTMESDVQGSELTLSEMLLEDWTDQDMYLTYTYHSLQPVWLSIRSEYYNALTVQQKAALEEASARMFGDIDARFLMREAEIEAILQGQDVLVNRYFRGARAEIHASLLNQEGAVEEAQRYVLDLISSLE